MTTRASAQKGWATRRLQANAAANWYGYQHSGATREDGTPRRITPSSTFKIPQDVKDAAAAKARERGETLTDVVVRALRRYAAKTP